MCFATSQTTLHALLLGKGTLCGCPLKENCCVISNIPKYCNSTKNKYYYQMHPLPRFTSFFYIFVSFALIFSLSIYMYIDRYLLYLNIYIITLLHKNMG